MTQPEMRSAWDSAFDRARERVRVRDKARVIRMRRNHAEDKLPKVLTFSDALERVVAREQQKGRL
jgi:hypothetical protein